MAYGLFLVRDAMPRVITLSSSGFTVQEEISFYVSSALFLKGRVLFVMLNTPYGAGIAQSA